MRDDRGKWDALRSDNDPIDINGVTIRSLSVKRQTLVSGVDILTKYHGSFGWPDLANGDNYALTVRRDRVLLVNHAPAPQDGWHEDLGHAVSDASDAYAIYEISGPNAFDLLKRGGEVSMDFASPSVARLMFGMGVFLYRFGDARTYRLHVASAQRLTMQQSLYSYLQGVE